jgi:hypothetical protein
MSSRNAPWDWVDRHWKLLRVLGALTFIAIWLGAGHFLAEGVASGYQNHDTAESARLIVSFVWGIAGGMLVVVGWIQSGD